MPAECHRAGRHAADSTPVIKLFGVGDNWVKLVQVKVAAWHWRAAPAASNLGQICTLLNNPLARRSLCSL